MTKGPARWRRPPAVDIEAAREPAHSAPATRVIGARDPAQEIGILGRAYWCSFWERLDRALDPADLEPQEIQAFRVHFEEFVWGRWYFFRDAPRPPAIGRGRRMTAARWRLVYLTIQFVERKGDEAETGFMVDRSLSAADRRSIARACRLSRSDRGVLARVLRVVLAAADRMEFAEPQRRRYLKKDLGRWLELYRSWNYSPYPPYVD